MTSSHDIDAAVASAFDRKLEGPAPAAQSGTAEPMLLEEAVDVTVGAAFGRVVDRARIAEAERAVEKKALSELAGLVREIAVLAQSRIGYSKQRAQLYAQSEALRIHESYPKEPDALRELRAERDRLVRQPGLASRTR